MTSQPTEQTFLVRGLQLAALTWGTPTPNQPPTLLVHGWQDQAGTWYRTAPHLSGYRIAIDLRGFGRSAHNPPTCAYAFAEYLVDLDQLITQLLDQTQCKQIRLVGHSMGGTICSIYAGLFPDRVQACALVDGLGIGDGLEGTVDRYRQHITDHRQPPTWRFMPDLETAARRLTQLYPRLHPEQAHFMASRATRPATENPQDGLCWRADPRHRIRLAVPYRADQHARILAEIHAPVLAVHPETMAFSPQDVASIEAHIPNLQRTVIADAGHMIPLDAPEALGRVLRTFLDGQG